MILHARSVEKRVLYRLTIGWYSIFNWTTLLEKTLRIAISLLMGDVYCRQESGIWKVSSSPWKFSASSEQPQLWPSRNRKYVQKCMNAGTYLAASRYAMPYHARPREMECIDYLRAYLTLHELLPFKLTPRNILRNCGVINMLLNRSYLSSPKISSLFARYLRISVECCIIFSIYYLRLFIL